MVNVVKQDGEPFLAFLREILVIVRYAMPERALPHRFRSMPPLRHERPLREGPAVKFLVPEAAWVY